MFSMWKVREIADKVTNVVMNYTEIEAKVREATNDDAWGPTGALMQEIAQATFTYEHFPEVICMLWKRMLQDNKTNWRRTYKSLLLLNYLIRNGSERVVSSSREHIYDLRSLENYTFLDEYGKDQGINIRHKVRELIDFIQDDDRLREERKKAKKNKDKYVGLSSDAGIGGRFGRDRWDDIGRNDWDSEKHSGGFQDSSYNSDEGEKCESDGEGNEPARSSNMYKTSCDSFPVETNKQKIDVKNNINSNVNSPSKIVKTVKKIDLGAAANYVGESSGNSNKSNVDLFNLNDDDFNPRAADGQEFGNFESAFPAKSSSASNTVTAEGSSAAPKSDEFADFAFAFTDKNQVVTKPNNNQNSLANFDMSGSTSLNPSNFIQNALSNTAGKNSNSDLLMGLQPTFNNPSQQSQQSNTMRSLLDGAESSEQTVLYPNAGDVGLTIAEEERHDELEGGDFRMEVDHACISMSGLFDKTQVMDTKILTQHLDYFIRLLPGNLTPQKLANVDVESERSKYFMENHYETILQLIVENVKIVSKQVMNELITKLFAVDGGNEMTLNYGITTLTEGIKCVDFPSESMDLLLDITKSVLTSDLISSAIVQACMKEDQELLEEFKDVLQGILTLPDIVSNRTKGKSSRFYTEMFPNVIFYHIGNCVKILESIGQSDTNQSLNLKALSFFLSKVSVRFARLEGLDTLIKAMELWVSANPQLQNLYVSLLSGVNKSAAELIAFTVLHICQSPKSVHRLWGDLVLSRPEFKYILTTKFTTLNYFDEVKYPKFTMNLIGYLYLTSTRLLFDLMMRILNIWCDSIAITHTPGAQHHYLTKIIVLSGFLLQNSVETQEKDEIRRALFDGVPVHLKSTDEDIRALGMITAELLVPRFMNVKAEVDLTFDYEIFSEQTKKAVNALRNIKVDLETTLNGDGDAILLGLMSTVDSGDKAVRANSEGQNRRSGTNGRTTHETLVVNAGPEEEEQDSDDDDYSGNKMDSDDDDLVPYDTSNDVKTFKVATPKYLRDLIDAIADRQDVEKFCASFECAQALIDCQLSDDDPEVGIDLLRLFISLDESYGIEDFLTKKFNCCLTVLCTHPIQGAGYLCDEFNAHLNKYSVSDRLFMLDLISTAARRLSELPKDVEEEVKIKKNPKEKDWEKIVKERIMINTRRFISKRKKTVSYKNNFHEVAGYFFFPLVKEFGICRLTFTKSEKVDTIKDEVLILTKFLNTISVVTYCSRNAPICLKIVKEVVELVWTIRYHPENKVRLAAMSCVGSVFLATPRVNLEVDLLDRIVDYRDWLLQSMEKDPDESCRTFATQLCLLIKDFEFT
ncbi:hypothetical protein RUM44_001792 [Polyplax serrata]|uniref:ENTH domain-containing protein n=1 Tax=Polyplax serrata TaxID=468196 RepID=A0ABR1AL22_POLSC